MRVTKVKYLDGYRLELSFYDHQKKIVNEKKIVDLKKIVSSDLKIFSELKDVGLFKKVRIAPEDITISWPNGFDLCPDVLYSMGK